MIRRRNRRQWRSGGKIRGEIGGIGWRKEVEAGGRGQWLGEGGIGWGKKAEAEGSRQRLGKEAETGRRRKRQGEGG